MVANPIRKQLLNEFENLSPEKQQRVLELTRELSHTLPPGTPDEVLLDRMGTFHFEPGDLDEIAQGIEEGTERVDEDGD